MRKSSFLVVLIAALVAAGCGGTTENVEAQAQPASGQDSWSSIGLPQQQKGGDDVTGPYEVVANWPENVCGAGYQGGSVGGVFAETPDRVFVFQRGCLPTVEANEPVPERNASGFDLSQKDPARHPRWDHVLNIFNRDGKLIES